uniref:Uncharacterized protein n=1 Tax=Attheya septentrionalis TaxID=420275 RepID=A0A7S2XM66_9STRA|mmetsp:Transcript_19960/g.36211  ORF Transcript_19960/g.36211 Transcript_19960/m.36211 type:complete len:330 (+) Transcript_19960:53-1042(+)|eukprot:CAMPEP_0198303740 /NCGR_PEP_ID=MMETSP1449-20131203/57044_1 /TAXON_ID=420275 /ORGANISM="Attheya septentrionalis, Strain CCMP2084" /LENGTH=329 /DNA_ID=CAMNT_0044006247 /DNA_START=465 /DNA_END=1454 /DNA_ORIENTATION=+
MMGLRNSAVLALLLATSASAFTQSSPAFATRSPTRISALLEDDAGLENALARELDYQPGAAKTAFADRYRDLSGKKIKTVAEAFSDFTVALGHPINALYKNMMTDIVGQCHLIVVNARFKKDALWSLGIMTTLELLLKNYPEKNISEEIVTALFKSIGLDEAEVRAEAKSLEAWIEGKSKEEVEAALRGEGDSSIAGIAKGIKADEFWMYSRFFGVGLVRLMDTVGVEMSMETAYPVMEDWMGTQLGKPFYTACSDSDMYFKIKAKLDMMETLMKEIEIREKKKMATRLEEKADIALKKAERDAEMKKETEAEKAEKATSSEAPKAVES